MSPRKAGGWVKTIIIVVVGILALKWLTARVNIPVVSAAVQKV